MYLLHMLNTRYSVQVRTVDHMGQPSITLPYNMTQVTFSRHPSGTGRTNAMQRPRVSPHTPIRAFLPYYTQVWCGHFHPIRSGPKQPIQIAKINLLGPCLAHKVRMYCPCVPHGGTKQVASDLRCTMMRLHHGPLPCSTLFTQDHLPKQNQHNNLTPHGPNLNCTF